MRRFFIIFVALIGLSFSAKAQSTDTKDTGAKEVLVSNFKLFPTQNMWNFILLDEVDGRSWQVQWSTDGKEGIVPINTASSL